MKLNEVLAASARLAASAAGLCLLLGSAALAGDRALLNIIGYSDDGRYFAFEEYGVQDGSGFAYSSVYVVDLPADKWTYGSPFTAQAPDDDADRPLATIRAQALAKAADKLTPLGINRPAEILVLLGDGVAAADGKQMDFAAPACCGPGQTQGDHLTLELTIFPVKPTEDYCTEMNPVGYALAFNDGDGSTELHRDGDILPKSRGCTLDYRLYAVVQPFERNGSRVAIVSSYPFGFEGPNRRFLAVPIDK